MNIKDMRHVAQRLAQAEKESADKVSRGEIKFVCELPDEAKIDMIVYGQCLLVVSVDHPPKCIPVADFRKDMPDDH